MSEHTQTHTDWCNVDPCECHVEVIDALRKKLMDTVATVRLLKEELAEARRLLKAMQPAQPTDLRLPGVLKLNKGVRE